MLFPLAAALRAPHAARASSLQEDVPASKTPAPGSGRIPIVVLTFNGGSDTLRCVESLRAPRSAGHPLVVVDNGSTDGSASLLASALWRDDAILINARNDGAAGGWNTGLLYGLQREPKYVFLVSNDTVFDGNVVDELAAYMEEHSDVAACGPRLHSMADPTMGVEYSWAHPSPAGPVDLNHVPIVAFMLRANVVREVGLFDEEMFVHWEDIDYSRRLLKAGHRLVYVPTRAKVLHRGGVTTSKLRTTAPYYYIRNEFLFARRHPRPGDSPPRLVARALLYILRWRMHPGWGIRGILEGLALWVANPPPVWRGTRTADLKTRDGERTTIQLGLG